MAIDLNFVQGQGGYYDKRTGAGPFHIGDDGTPVAISGGGGGGSSGGLTDAQLRATPVDMNMVSGHFRRLPEGEDRSGTIAAADTWQQLAPATPERTGLSIQVISDEGELWITEFTTGDKEKGSPGTYRVQAGQVFWALTSNAIDVLSSTVGLKFTSTETLDS